MRKVILIIFISLLFSFFLNESVLAKNISEKQVRHVAQNFLTYKSLFKSRVLHKHIQYYINTVEPVIDPSGISILAYLVKIQPKGFLIISTDTDLEPVIAYSFRHNWDFRIEKDNVLYQLLLPNLKGGKKDSYTISSHRIKENNLKWSQGFIAKKLDDMLFYQWPEEDSTATDGWIVTTWHQRAPYNNFCPLDKFIAERSVVGCGATAMAQIVNYHNYIGDLNFTEDDTYVTYEGIEIDADSLTYDFPAFAILNTYFDSIRFKYDQNEELNLLEQAALSFACGISIKNNYSSGASGAASSRINGSFQEKMNYHSADFLTVNREFYRQLIQNLVNGLPAILEISGYRLPDHAIIADGYNSDGYFHLNFGWGAASPSPISDMWCILPDSIANNYETIDNGVLNIIPEVNTQDPQIILSDSVVYLSGSGIGEASDLKHLSIQNTDDDQVVIRVKIYSDNFFISTTGSDFDSSIEPAVLQPGEQLILSTICIPDIDGELQGKVYVLASNEQGEKYWVIDLIRRGIAPGTRTRINGGIVSGLWERAGSPYCICGDIFVAPSEELTIEPGVEIVFNGPFQFSIANDAQLVAKGTETNPIYFTAFNIREGWRGFSFNDSDNDDTLAYCHMTNINTQRDKAVIEILSSDPIITHCRIEKNNAGAFYLSQSSAKIIGLSINGNKSGQNGGAFNLYLSSPYIANSVIYKNKATRGGAIYGYESFPSLVNLTIANNEAYDKGGAIFITGKSIFSIRNSIIWDNEANSGLIVASEDAANENIITFNYSDIDTISSNWLSLSDISDKDKMILWEDGNKCIQPGQKKWYFREFTEYGLPFIDTGDPDPAYYDIEDPLRPGIPLYAKGWLRNDMGAYGGPYKIVTCIGNKQYTKLNPDNFLLFQNYPNPFNPKTIISWQLTISSNVELSIYNILGQKIENLINKPMPAGYHEIEFNGQNLSSGIYLYRIVVDSYGEVADPARRTGAWQDVKKMVLLR